MRVVQVPTTLALTCPTGLVYGQDVIFVAAVTAPGQNPTTGVVTFSGGVLGGSVSRPLSGGNRASYLVPTLVDAGTYTVSATYSMGRPVYLESSTTCTFTVSRADTTVGLTSLPNPSAPGQPVTLVASVAGSGRGSVNLTGTVTFVDTSDGTVLGTRPVDAGSKTATLTTTFSSPGSHPVVATYSGDSNFNPASSAPLVQQVGSAGSGTQLSLTKSAGPTSGSAPLTVTYTYTLVNGGGDTLFHVAVTDDSCSPVAYQSGDANHDQLLQPGETWTFTCTQTFSAPGGYTNHATAAGTDTQTGLAVNSNTATATINVTSPPASAVL